ncbi:MAG: peptidoglycan recognition family protein [Dermatophilus congolensis]|nr:peptidoglycan recognition family protein [Dermatophilus congolensis]
MAGTYRGLRTRAQVGLRRQKSVSRNISPGGSNGGVTIHYGGGRVGITPASPHSRCEQVWRDWQVFHMNTRGWADIAYTGAFCQHGYALAGRGSGVRTAAQGSNEGNLRSYAVAFIGGEGDTPSQDAYAALDWWIIALRASGAGPRVWGHRDWSSTSCPGTTLLGAARARDRATIANPTRTSAARPPRPAGVPALLREDGVAGPATFDALVWYTRGDRGRGLTRDNVRDIETWAARPRNGVLDVHDIRAIQRKVGARIDGDWPRTNGDKSNTTLALQRFLNRRIRQMAG